MKSNVKQSNREAAFTIVELLTVMSIIVILIGLLVPALNKVKQFAREVKQKAQFHSIEAAIELFNSEFDDYPHSDALDPDGEQYCGAMKLCEAMMGRDLMGFHPDSIFRSNGMGSLGINLYPPQTADPIAYRNSLSARKGPYLPLENANAFQLRDLYKEVGPFAAGESFVLCDVFRRVTHLQSGQKVGMPILYYKANTANTQHDISNPDNPQNIYDYRDNNLLVMLGKPFDPPPNGEPHRLAIEPGRPPGYRFYMNTTNDKVLATTTAAVRPYRADTYILISAGNDGEYGTPDDICNFDWRYREQP